MEFPFYVQALLEHDGQRVGLLAGGTTGIPYPHWAVLRPVLSNWGIAFSLRNSNKPGSRKKFVTPINSSL